MEINKVERITLQYNADLNYTAIMQTLDELTEKERQ